MPPDQMPVKLGGIMATAAILDHKYDSLVASSRSSLKQMTGLREGVGYRRGVEGVGGGSSSDQDSTNMSRLVRSLSSFIAGGSSEELDSPCTDSPATIPACNMERVRSRSRVEAGASQQQKTEGSIVRICFRFLNQPEWLPPGARLIVRDRCDGHIAGAGFLGPWT